MKEVYILKKSKRKNKRFVIIMPDKGHKHHFGSDIGKTFVDGRTQSERENWIKRHSVNKNWNNKHSGIYYSRYLLWSEPTLKEAIKKLEKLLDVKIKVEL